MTDDELVYDMVPHGLLVNREVGVIVLQPSSLGLRRSKEQGRNDGWNPAAAKVEDCEPADALHGDNVGQVEKEEELVTLEQVHVLSGLPQGPEALGDLEILAAVLAWLLSGQLANQQGLHELAHKIKVAVEGQEGVLSIFPGVVPDDSLAPRVPAGPFGDVDFAIDGQSVMGVQAVLLNLLGDRCPLALVPRLPMLPAKQVTQRPFGFGLLLLLP